MIGAENVDDIVCLATLQFGIFNNNQGGTAFSVSPTVGFFPALFGLPFVRVLQASLCVEMVGCAHAFAVRVLTFSNHLPLPLIVRMACR